ncbi:ABC transporter ATP-binding protein [Allopusillimonas ginsengisoli]|uniref:ABC transporter ATP-binding protein n=1 Tax=Allopusillimonas ginsengisoli TaxID=453575 RepID=UPI0031450162
MSAEPERPVLLTVQALNAWYGAAHILRDVSLQARRGEVVALLGRNGAGKSTTFKAIMGLAERRAAALDFMGHALAHRQPFEIARLGLGYVPEDRRIFTDLTVTENLMAGRQAVRTWPQSAVPDAGREVGGETLGWSLSQIFDVFPHLASLRNRPAGAMSGGEQQMLAVARTLMGNPFLLLLDEPSEGVAPVVVEQMAEMILALKQRGVSVLLSEQNLHFAQLVADRAYVLEKGEIRYQGSMRALADDETVRRAYLEL